MKFRSACLLICLVSLGVPSVFAGVRPWTEVRSPHFRVLTNSNSSDARDVAYEFEQMRYVFATLNPQFRLDSGAPLTIFAVRDEQTARTLEPLEWKRKGEKPAGTFQHGWEKQYVMLRLDYKGDTAREIVYHEYAHSILHMNSHWLPTWLDEGMAEFYAYTRFQDHKIYVGGPTARVNALRGNPIPLETLLNVDPSSPYYHDADEVDMFYAESWALVHYLIFAPGMDSGRRFNQFFMLLQRGMDQKQAFQQAFGDIAKINQGLDQSLLRFTFTAAALKDPPQIDKKLFTSRKLTIAETEAELAGFHLWNHDLVHARPLVDKAMKDDPKLGMAHEENGFLLFADGNDAAAAKEFSQAYSLDPTLYLSLFAKTMLSPIATSNAPADQAAFHDALIKVLDLNPQFAPAYVQLARLAVRQNNLKTAFALSRKAEELEPSRAGYHLMTGQILLRMGQDAQAGAFAQYVAPRWFGPDHNEAVELWNDIPAAQRPAGKSLSDQTPKDTQSVAGIVKSVACVSKTPWTLVLTHEGKPLTFHAAGPFAVGFSDTLWYGEDHFSDCHHLDGLRAIVHYRPAKDASYSGDVAEIEVRDDLPASPAAHQKASAGQ